MLKRLAIPYTVTLVALNAAVGILRSTESANRTQSTAYKYAKQIMPLHWWGVVFLVVAVLIFASYRSTLWIRTAACLGFGLWTLWAGLTFTAALTDGRSSFVGSILYVTGAIRHFQVVRRR